MNHGSESTAAAFPDVDPEWAELIILAKELGFSYDDIKHFFKKNASETPENLPQVTDTAADTHQVE